MSGARDHANKKTAMPQLLRLALCAAFILIAPLAASADEGQYPIMADDGTVIANHALAPDLEARIEKLPGVIVAANPKGKVTLNEFYDVNCPYCRVASGDIDALIKSNRELRLVLVPFPVLGIASIQGTRVELAVARLASAKKFYDFHRMLDKGRGVVEGGRALAAAKAIGLDVEKVRKIANEDSISDEMIAHVRLGDALKILATPGFVIKGVAINGYPGPKSLAALVASVQRCGAVICESK
jgi:protein-disulfide isomerase